jgi:hypothetical protein
MMVTRLYLIKNGKKILVDEVQMYLACTYNCFKEEIYDTGLKILEVDNIHIRYGCYVDKNRDRCNLSGTYSVSTNKEIFRYEKIVRYETISEAFFDLQSLKKTCFTFLFYDDVFLSIEIERSDDE